MLSKVKGAFILIAVLLILVTSSLGGAVLDRLYKIKILDQFIGRSGEGVRIGETDQRLVKEESVVIEVAEEVSPSVVTVSIQTPRRRVLDFSPFGGFQQRIEGGADQDIGSGFIVSEDGLIITNKHVVSSDGTYKVITNDEKEYGVEKISRDPSNDIAVLKINPSAVSGQVLKPVKLGDSSNLKVGQFVIAIGTALGEFRHTVTTGVISGLGRGITAGSYYEGYVEKLDDVIQTDAAINPGNSGGPLLNSSGQVIGISVAVAADAQNIGFAIPVNVVKTALEEFNKTGSFSGKAFLGVEYQMISRQSAIMNDLPQGAYVVNIVDGSPADLAGIEADDIIIKIAGERLADQENGLSDVIKNKKPGDKVEIEIFREDKTLTLTATLSEYEE
ncbi:MAG: protease Do [Candidatus Woesebacteria bacterium GW2011_GWC1_38_13]|uniref:Protease Do n=2 Tax=Candidatus Woeseibacteriota TaxID=1752722 RepID=A0A0G0L7K4_9BACT|nr:MAG: protease Do [Candidatus Woesebacteria bacterium GW2011_GWC1_38_13]KKQ76492.1 MAG: protease Do [Microgenomates group bacterium GW2011_GWF1_38_5]KKQ83830.1 MAG: protease Do [Candidatus Woesebacteria bacterium GW2011_GWA1_38_8]